MKHSLKRLTIIAKNTVKVLSEPVSLLSGLFSLVLFLYLGRVFINLPLLIGNLGATFAYIEVVLHVLLSVVFALFIAASVFKVRYFSHIEKTKSATWFLGSFLGIIVVGCPSCSLTLASYIGLAGALSVLPLPFHGIELKILWLIILIVVVYYVLRDLMVCKIVKKKTTTVKNEKTGMKTKAKV